MKCTACMFLRLILQRICGDGTFNSEMSREVDRFIVDRELAHTTIDHLRAENDHLRAENASLRGHQT